MSKNTKNLFRAQAFLILFSALIIKAHASQPTVYFHLPQESVAPGSEFSLTVLINSDVEINAIQLAVEFTPENLEFLGYSNANSVVNIWQENPTLISGNLVGFSGGLTQSFKGIAGEIIKLNFKAKTSGTGGFALRESNLYLADGNGSRIDTPPFYLRLAITEDSPKTELVSIADKTPPQIQIASTENPADGQKLLVVEVKDKESGSGQVLVRALDDWKWSSWVQAQNPIQFPKTAWAIEIKALNGAGQENNVLVWSKNLKLLISVLSLILILAAFYICYNIYKSRRKRG